MADQRVLHGSVRAFFMVREPSANTQSHEEPSDKMDATSESNFNSLIHDFFYLLGKRVTLSGMVGSGACGLQ